MPEDRPALPDYRGGGIVNLMSSVAATLGAPTPYPPLALLPPGELAGVRHLLLLVIDGLGHGFLLRREGVLRQHLRGRITSVFPSTTASAIPSFLTGLAPQQHGLTGWHMYLREIGAVVAPLPFRTRLGRQPLAQAGLTPVGLFGLEPLANRLPLPCHVVAPQHIVHSEFNTALAGRARRHGFGSLDELFVRLAELLRQGGTPSYIYAYWPELDSLAHEHGVASPQVAQAHAALEAAFARFLEAVRGCEGLVLVTADHGFVDTSPEETLDLDAHPGLRACLLLPLTGEPRMAFAHVRAGCGERLQAYVRQRLDDRVELLRSEDILRRGWLGPGEPHPELAARLGDYVLIPRGRGILRDWLPGEERHVHVGVHGGMSEAEMYVPLVVVPTGAAP